VNPIALLAAAPAVPYDKAGRYVAAAFIVLFAVVLIYVAIMATKLQRLERDLSELNSALDAKERAQAAATAAPAAPEEPTVGAETT
jgi:hypothetical protein